MDDYVRQNVCALHRKLMDKPIMNIVVRITNISRVLTSPQMIQDKLDANAYITPFDFALDVRTMFISVGKVAQNREQRLAIDDLSRWFEKHFNRLALTKEEEFYQRTEKARRKLYYVRRAMSMSAARPAWTTDSTMTADSKAAKHAPVTLINEIQTLLAAGTSVEIQKQIISVLKRHIPNFVPSEMVTIQASDITMRCAEELRDILRSASDKE